MVRLMVWSSVAICMLLYGAAGCADGAKGPAATDAPRVVADRLFWSGPEGNLAIEVDGKFNSRAEMVKTLALDAPVGRWQGKTWILADILVSFDCNAMGDVATWTVSGPKPLVRGYVEGLKKQYQAKNTFYDFYAAEVDLKPTGFFEREEQ